MAGPEPDLRKAVVEAFEAADPEAALYLDRVESRVVTVKHGATDVPELAAREVEDDQDRFVEIPAVTEGELHGWIEEFVEGRGDPGVAALLDERKGANERFLDRLAKRDPTAFADWRAFRAARVAELVDQWLAAAEKRPRLKD